MQYRTGSLALVAMLAAGCVGETAPTEPFVEQAVFTALGGLAPGQSISLTGEDAAEVLVGGIGTEGEFVYIPFHASTTQGANLRIQVSGEDVGASASLGASPRQPLVLPDRGESPDWAMHERLHRSNMAAVAPVLDRHRRATLGPSTDLEPRTDLSGGNAAVGDLVAINATTIGPACTSSDLRTGRVEAITQQAIIVGDIDNPAGGFTRSQYEEFGREFDEIVHPTVTRYFSEPTDIDENGRVIVFFTRAVNELTQDPSDGYVAGFFYARDLFPQAGCPASNQGEIFYVLAPDPTGLASPLQHSLDRVVQQGLGTIGHEYQHLINASRRIYVNDADSFEESWLDEGLSHIAEELIFYEVAGLAPGSNLTLERVRADPVVLAAINRFGISNLVRYALYLERVTRESPTNSDGLETRGAAWSFLRYAADHSERTDLQFFNLLGNTAATGFQNLSAALDGEPLDWLQQWGVSVYTDDLVSGGEERLQQPSWNFRSLLPAIFNTFPLVVETLNVNASESFNLRSTTSGYLRVEGLDGEVARLRTTSGGVEPPPTLRVTVVRID